MIETGLEFKGLFCFEVKKSRRENCLDDFLLKLDLFCAETKVFRGGLNPGSPGMCASGFGLFDEGVLGALLMSFFSE